MIFQTEDYFIGSAEGEEVSRLKERYGKRKGKLPTTGKNRRGRKKRNKKVNKKANSKQKKMMKIIKFSHLE